MYSRVEQREEKGRRKEKKKVKGKREEKMIARNVHYLSEGEEKEEERLTFRQIERKARREIFRARRYNYDVARYILLLISRVSCESCLGFSFFTGERIENHTSGP